MHPIMVLRAPLNTDFVHSYPMLSDLNPTNGLLRDPKTMLLKKISGKMFIV